MLDIQQVSTELMLGQDGIWYSKDDQEISYPSDGNETYFALEDNSFWFKHRNNCIVKTMQQFPPQDLGTIFDIGGGNGYVSQGLSAAGFDVALVEPGRTGASNAKKRGVETVICATTDTAQFKPESLSAMGLFDVVEHIEDDLSFLKSLNTLLKPKGRVYITVPAYAMLWSEEDISAGHYRRYTREGINKVLQDAGFEVEFSSYFFRFLPLPIALLRALPFRLGLSGNKDKTQSDARDHATGGGLANKVLDTFLNFELKKLENKQAMNFGGSCLIVATKP